MMLTCESSYAAAYLKSEKGKNNISVERFKQTFMYVAND